MNKAFHVGQKVEAFDYGNGSTTYTGVWWVAFITQLEKSVVQLDFGKDWGKLRHVTLDLTGFDLEEEFWPIRKRESQPTEGRPSRNHFRATLGYEPEKCCWGQQVNK